MKLHKVTRYLLVITFSLFIVSCSSPSGLTIVNSKNQNIDEGLLKWEEIAQVNEKFLATDGWIEIRNHVTPSSDARQHYTESHTWIRLGEGHIIEGLTSIFDPETGEEFQRFVINPEGMQGELIELRAIGLEASEGAEPLHIDWSVADISPTRQELSIIKDRKSILANIKVEEAILDNGVSIISFTVEYGQGNAEGIASLVPESYGYIGKVEKYLYNKETGTCYEKQESYIKEGGQQTGISKIAITIIKHQYLPKEIDRDLTVATEELDYYVQLFYEP
jgi:hypothetical protein